MTKNATDSSRQALPHITVVTIELPRGQEGLRYSDLRIVALSPRLDEAGRHRALAELAERLGSA